MRKWLRILIFSGAGLVVVLVLLLGLLWRASQQEPAFYREALEGDAAERAEASDRLLQRATTLAGEVKQEGRWEATFTADEINGWLAVDLVDNHSRQLPDALSDPRVSVEADRLTIACRYRHGRLNAVLSLAVDAYLAEPNVLTVRIRKARAGTLPLPLDKVIEQLSQAAERSGLRIQWRQAEGDPVAMISLPPPSGKDAQAIEIDTFKLADGQIHVAGTTEKR